MKNKYDNVSIKFPISRFENGQWEFFREIGPYSAEEFRKEWKRIVREEKLDEKKYYVWDCR